MSKITLNLTEDHLKLASFFLIEDGEEQVTINKKIMLTEQSHILDDVSMILGLRHKAIKASVEDADGMAFPDDVEEYMLEIYKYVSENMYWIELLIHQFFYLKDGVTPGTYECDSKVKIFEKK